MEPETIGIRLLGDLQVSRGGQAVALPASKRTRALLGYLVATGAPQSRERLCDLLWEGPEDPRASLRWALTKLRPLLNDPSVERLAAGREHVAFVPGSAKIDAATARLLLARGAQRATVEDLEEAARLLAGEFLDGLDLPRCYRFHAWCMAERESLGALRREAISALVERLRDAPERALAYARAWIGVEPLSESGHAAVVRLLGALGRLREAHEHCASASRLLERELSVPLTGELNRAAAAVRPAAAAPGTARAGRPAPSPAPVADESVAQRPPFVGREAERAQLDQAIERCVRTQPGRTLFVLGDPGIGKTRLLDYLCERAAAVGCRVLRARGFEAEMVRPYGAWIDALREVPAGEVPAPAQRDLALLLPSLGSSAPGETNRARLFESMVALLRALMVARPLVLAFDDVQWLDEASLSLLHFVARAFERPAPVLIACAARAGEIEDNAALALVRQSLEREMHLADIVLAPLDAAQTGELLRSVYPELDSAEVVKQSSGNPFFALELARARGHGDNATDRPIDALIVGELARLDEPARELATWAAAYGREILPELLGEATGMPAARLAPALRVLERRGLLRATGGGGYDFAHDLVREATYRSLSQARRRLLHRGLARALERAAGSDHALLADLAHHAGLAGDDATAARAFAGAADRSLRIFASVEALELVTRGLAHLERQPEATERTRLRVELLRIRTYALGSRGVSRERGLAEELASAVAAAQAAGLHREAAGALFALSFLHYHSGDSGQTRTATLQAAEATLPTDAATRARQLAGTARCLLDVDADVAGPRAMIAEAEELARSQHLTFTELEWARGLLLRWDGDLDNARTAIERALAVARANEERWREYECLVWLALVDMELRRLERVYVRCNEIEAVARRLGETDAAVAGVLRDLARMAQGAPDAVAAFATSVERLRGLDNKAYLAYALNWAAAIHLDAGRLDGARACALEALEAAKAVERITEMVVARALLAQLAARGGDVAATRDQIERLASTVPDPQRLSARARAHLATAATASGVDITTLAPTGGLQNGIRASQH
jgi:DNA-binding SARP family transcriptional activator/tetratricopeptide (TPR) repeat protein